ncbi:MAG: helix-turn-helix domain-containing protein, partial [Acidobacteriota bacterium]|nr:helix-turn-helix domain-containing protein [Acidobacteriota bacterium]
PSVDEAKPSRYHEAIDAERRRLVSLALELSGGKRSLAARQLGITPQALSYILRRLDFGTRA